jgi:hypothetical protein
MKTRLGTPTDTTRENVFDQLGHWIEFYRKDNIQSIPSFWEYEIKYTHDGISVTPKHSNHIGITEMKIFNEFCEDKGWGLSVYVSPGATAPSIEINLCQ